MSDVKVDDRLWQKLVRAAHGLKEAYVKVGIMRSEGGEQVDGLSLVEIAAVHEFGSRTTPERSFIRRTTDAKRDAIAALCAKLCKQVVTDRMKPDRALAVLGAFGAAEVKKTITEGDGIPPALAASTIKAKGSSRPLVDTGRMLNAITYEVVSNDTALAQTEDERRGI